MVVAYSACMGLPLFRRRISGSSAVTDLSYQPTDGDEVEDLHALLAYVKETLPGGVQAVCSGAIASDYQRIRVENVCSRLNLVSLAYLWHQPQRALLRWVVALCIAQ
jgi:diphthine-ammonia ligase